MLARLRHSYGRLQTGIDVSLRPALRQDVYWYMHEVNDTRISDKFRVEIGMRNRDNTERDPNGASSQLTGFGKVKNFPLALHQFCAYQMEVDLQRKEWITDCESLSCAHGGHPKLCAQMQDIVLAPPLLPFGYRVENLIFRQCCVCDKVPDERLLLGDTEIPGGIALLMVETSASDGVTEFDGFDVPPVKSRHIRTSGTTTVFWATHAQELNGHCDIFVAVNLGLPIPPSIMPLSLFKRILCSTVAESMLTLRTKVVDHWDEFEFKDRILARPEIYDQLRPPAGPADA